LLAEVIARYPELNAYIGRKDFKLPDWLDQVVTAINVHMVQDQRLIRRDEIHRESYNRRQQRPIDTIEQYAADLKGTMKHCKPAYDMKARTLDASFPARLLAKPYESETFDSVILREKFAALRVNYKRLKTHGLLTKVDPFNFDIAEILEEDRKFLSLYVQDHTDKLRVYDDILKRVELFTEILNNKGLAFKNVSVTPDEGFSFISDAEKVLGLTQLSSGEKHQVVLIDEPEISLHIAWQKEFLVDIKLFNKLFDTSKVKLESLAGKENVKAVVKTVVAKSPERILGVCDADFDHHNEVRTRPAIFLTDSHDSETMIAEFATEDYKEGLQRNLLQQLLCLAYETGLLKWLNVTNHHRSLFVEEAG
jgi:hypothetical protein